MSMCGELVSLKSLIDRFAGVLVGLDISKPELDKRLKQYFLWHNEMPFLERATSNPRKYLIRPQFFI